MRIFKTKRSFGHIRNKKRYKFCIVFLIIMDKKTYLYIMYYFDKNDG